MKRSTAIHYKQPLPEERSLFIREIKHVYGAEKTFVKALPKMFKAATSEKLATVLEDQLAVTHQHILKLEDIFYILELEAEVDLCPQICKLVDETEQIIKTKKNTAIRDEKLLYNICKADQYQIDSYRSLERLANAIGRKDVAKMIHTTLQQKETTGKILTEVVMPEVVTQPTHI